MRALLALAIFALAASAYASTLTVNVTGLSDTALVGTKIEILKNSIVILNDTADKFGIAQFDVSDGYYIVRTTRGFYPVKVQIANVQGDSVAKIRMDLDSNTATLYGRVTYGKQDLDGYKIYATQNGVVIKEARVYPEGVYILTFLDEGSYDLVFSKGEWEPLNVTVPLAARETKLLDVGLSAMSEGGVVGLSVPPSSDLYGTILARLVRGDAPMNGTEISVLTPDGITKLTTDANGEARINAAKPGNYTFTYANITASSFVAAPAAAGTPGGKPTQQPPKKAPAPLPQVAGTSGAQATGGASDNTLFFIVGIVMVGIGVILAGAVAFVMLRKQKAVEEKHAQMHSRGVSHQHTREEYHELHGHEAHPMHPEHAEHAAGHEKHAHSTGHATHPHEKYMSEAQRREIEPPHEHEKYMHPADKEKLQGSKASGSKANRKK